ncbi:hypothetical protein ZWY2020_003499 [Hordeum vulgare]|nr:hypothetical protein ZWY2020_003499 [Hordeum vulgare]
MAHPLPSTAPSGPSSSRHGSTLSFYTPPFSASDKSTPLWLSNLDLAVPKTHTPLVYYYPAPAPAGDGGEKEAEGFFTSERLWEALARALVPFYPLAGRMAAGPEGRLEIDCNGEGALFIVARAWRHAVRTQVDAIHHCCSWCHTDHAMGILAELYMTESLLLSSQLLTIATRFEQLPRLSKLLTTMASLMDGWMLLCDEQMEFLPGLMMMTMAEISMSLAIKTVVACGY